MESTQILGDRQEQEPDRLATDAPDAVSAWSEIEPGRFMPRRIRGSYRGGKLG